MFADTEPGCINLSARTIAPCITARTRALLCVHKSGILCDMDSINALASERGLLVFEDCCQSVFGEYKGRLAGTLGDAACFSFDPEKTLGSDTGGCMVTNDAGLHERTRFLAQNRAGVMKAGFGRVHPEIGYAYRMPHCTAAICLAQLEIVREQVTKRDEMARLVYRLLGEIPGITPLQVPDYVNVYSCWMAGFNLDPEAFTCSAAEFGALLSNAGLSTAGEAEYYLMPAALECIQTKVREKRFPYVEGIASRDYSYSAENCPNAAAFLSTFVRWVTFCERYEVRHCEMVARLVAEIADQHRRTG